MKREDFIEKVLNSTNSLNRATPNRDLFRGIYNTMQQNKTLVVSIISFPKVAAIAAAFSGLLLLNIWLLSGSTPKKRTNSDMQQLIEQYGLVNDDIISFQ
jgi:hypothetical protein